MSSLEFAELLGSCYPLGQQSAQERIITVDDALQAMSDAQDQLQGFVSENAEDELVIQQISHHISMRIVSAEAEMRRVQGLRPLPRGSGTSMGMRFTHFTTTYGPATSHRTITISP